ncbi:MAG: SWIM zinc finger family protein [Thermales bacterium]|nr:SWIM zinc finger family protein [Thermales bacterium]
MTQSATCECPYYAQYGLCKHIVGVCASLDQEFGSKYREFDASEEILDNIFASQKVKTHRKWLETMDTLLSRDTGNYYYLDNISRTIKTEEGQHQPFFDELTKIVEVVIGDYSREKLLVRVILESILVGGQCWFDYWSEYFLQLDQYNQINLFKGLWKIYWVTAQIDYKEKLKSVFRNPVEQVKLEVFNELFLEFGLEKNIWLEYCFVAEYYSWLDENFENLDPLTLVRYAEIFPECRENVDLLILNQIKMWSDFLPTGEYGMVIEVFQEWGNRLGKGDFYSEALEYFRTNHPRKKKLLNQLD